MASIREKINMLSYELNSKEKKLKQSNETIKGLQQKIYDKEEQFTQHQENISMYIDEVGIE